MTTPNTGQADPNQPAIDPATGQPAAGPGGTGGAPPSPTEFVELGGAKVPRADFEKLARENFKDHFDAYDNREKWQKTNSERAMQLKDAIRKADAYDRLVASQGAGGTHQPNTPEARRQHYVAKRAQQFPDVDPRFFETQFDDMMEFSELRAKEIVGPLYQQSDEQVERDFMRTHPDVIPESVEYRQIAGLYARGYDLEDAYEKVFREKINNARTEEAIRLREEDAKRKLQQARTGGSTGTLPKPKSFDESFERAWNMHSG